MTLGLFVFPSPGGGCEDGESGSASVIGSAPLGLPLWSAFITTSFDRGIIVPAGDAYSLYVGVLLRHVMYVL